MALKRTFARMFPDMASQVFASREAEVTGWVPSAKEPLALLLPRGRVCLTRLGIVVRARLIILVVVVHVHVHVYGGGSRALAPSSLCRLVTMVFCAAALSALT